VDWPSLPAVVLSADNEVVDAVRAMKCGAIDYLTKPFNPDELTAILRNARRLRRAELENEATRVSVFVTRDFECGNELQQLRFGLGFEIYLEIVDWKTSWNKAPPPTRASGAPPLRNAPPPETPRGDLPSSNSSSRPSTTPLPPPSAAAAGDYLTCFSNENAQIVKIS